MNGARKEQGPAPVNGSIYSAESVQDVASSLGMNNLPEELLQRLAKDVEYRIYQVVEEAARFTRHGKRTTMSTQDIEQAFQVMNIEPLYGHLSHMNSTFRRTVPNPANTGSKSTVPVFFVEDEEIDFDKVLRDERVTLPKAVSWHAHWLAVEGIQPLTADNPPKPPLSEQKGRKQSPPRSVLAPVAPAVQTGKRFKPVKHVLSRELQIYYSRLTAALLPPSNEQARRTAALASLHHDAGLQNLLPYLVRWVGQSVVTAIRNSETSSDCGPTLEILLQVIHALIQNERLFIEPYLHQILPPLLSILLTSSLPPEPATLRRDASEILAYLSLQHGTTYPSLSERLTKTLLLALLSPDKTSGSREGAVRGLASLSPQAIERGLIESGGARVIGDDAVSDQDGEVLAVMDALAKLKPPSKTPEVLDEMEGDILQELEDMFGPRFARLISQDEAWAKALLNKNPDS